MAYGKNKGLAKGGKKGQKKRAHDPFLKKVWYDIKAPTYFGDKRRVGRTMVTKTAGQKIETDGLKGRVAEFNLHDMNGIADDGHKKIKLEVQEIQGKSCLTDFHGMSLTRDFMCKLMKKKYSIVEAFADCKTTDGFVVRLFALGFTQRHKQQTSYFTYAQTAKIKKCRKKMVQIMQEEVAKGPLKDAVKAITLGKLEQSMKQCTQRIFPLDPLHIIKAKCVKKPKMDIVKLMEIHEKGDVDSGVAVTEDNEESKNLLAGAPAAE